FLLRRLHRLLEIRYAMLDYPAPPGIPVAVALLGKPMEPCRGEFARQRCARLCPFPPSPSAPAAPFARRLCSSGVFRESALISSPHPSPCETGGKFPISPLFVINRQRSAPASATAGRQQHKVN